MIRFLRTPKSQDPQDQRFVASGKGVRFFYGAVVAAAVLAMAYWAAKPLIFLEGAGTVEAPAQSLSFPYLADIKFIAVRPGQSVERGTVLAILKRSDADTVRDGFEERLFNARVRLKELQNRQLIASSARAAAADRSCNAQAMMARIERANKQFINANYVASMQREHSEAADRLAVLDADLKTLPDAIAEVLNEIKYLNNNMELIKRTWAHIELISKFHGNIGPNIMAEGSTVVPGQTIMKIYQEDKKYILWRMPSFSLTEPRRGDAVGITYGRKSYDGVVSRVLPVSEVVDNDNSHGGRLVEVEVKDDLTNLPLGAVVEVSLTYLDLI